MKNPLSSAHRTPQRMFRYAEIGTSAGLRIIIAVPACRPICRGWWASETNPAVSGAESKPPRFRASIRYFSIVQSRVEFPSQPWRSGKAGAKNAGIFRRADARVERTNRSPNESRRSSRKQHDDVIATANLNDLAAGKGTV